MKKIPSVCRSPSVPTPLAGALLGAALLFGAPSVDAQEPFCETDGLVVAEIESIGLSGSWVQETNFAGYTGSGYYRWAGGNQYNNPGQGVLTVILNIVEEGDYQMRIRNYHDEPDATLENDCWTRMDGGTWVKTYSKFNNTWTWSTRFEYADHTKEDAHYYLTPGLHTFQMSGRSFDFCMDRVHFYLPTAPTATDPSWPESQQGECDGPTVHPNHNPRSVTAVFADGGLGGFSTMTGTPVVLDNPPGDRPGKHLALADSTRLVLPGRDYEDQEVLVKLRAGMPEGSWIGVIVRAASENDDFSAAGTQTMVFMQRQVGTGRVKVQVHDGAGIVMDGPWFEVADVDVGNRRTSLRVATSGPTINAYVNGFDALPGGYNLAQAPAGGGVMSLRTIINPSFPGTIGIDHVLVRSAGDIPDVHFDGAGRLWMSALEDSRLLPGTWQPNTFLFTHEIFSLGINVFLSAVLPLMDYQDFDDDHFIMGVVDSGLALGIPSETTFEYKGQVEGEFLN